MPNLSPDDKVRVVYEANRNLKEPLCYPYMDGIEGTVANIYNEDEVAIEVNLASLPKVMLEVHTEAAKRLRLKLLEALSEEGKKKLTEAELNFTPHYVALLQSADLNKI